MSKLLSIFLTAGLLLYPFATYAADYGSQSSQNQQVPPVAQTLVREGDFAIKLASELGLSTSSEEAEAIDTLARAGVVPSNGWIPDYPVTPEIIGQLSDSIVLASKGGKLPVSSDRAEKSLTDIAVGMNLPLPGGYGTAGYRGEQGTGYNSTVVNNYYYNDGPPVITYYPPPADYLYLYDWVPYPVVWFGFAFPGFFICHNFTTVVSFTSFPHHHHFRTPIVTNHIIDPVTRRSAFIHHVFRSRQGVIHPQTAVVTGNGRMFRNVAEFRQGFAAGGGTGLSSRTRRLPSAVQGPHSAFNTPSGTMRPDTGLSMRRRANDPASIRRVAPPIFTRPQISPRMTPRSMPAAPSIAPSNNGRQFATPGTRSQSGVSSGRAAGGGGFHGHSGGRRG